MSFMTWDTHSAWCYSLASSLYWTALQLPSAYEYLHICTFGLHIDRLGFWSIYKPKASQIMVLAFGACRSKTRTLVQNSHKWWKSGTRRWKRLQSATQNQKTPNPSFQYFGWKQGILGRSESRHGRNRVSLPGALQPSRIEIHSYLPEIGGGVWRPQILCGCLSHNLKLGIAKNKKGHCNSTQNPFYIESGCWPIWAFLCTCKLIMNLFMPVFEILDSWGWLTFWPCFHLTVWPNKLTIFKHMVSLAFPHLVGPDSSPKCFEGTSVASAKAHKLNK